MADDTLCEQLAETIERELRAHPTIAATPSNPGVIGTFGGMRPHELADALLPRIREHTAAAVQAERERAEVAEARVELASRDADYLGARVRRAEAAIERVRSIAFDSDTISALERGVVESGPNQYDGLTKDEALGYAVDALRDIRAALDGSETS